MVDRYDPWEDVERRGIRVGVLPLAGRVPALYVRSGDDRCILLGDWLSPVERTAHLAHELVHDDREGGCHQPGIPDRLRPIVTRDERRCDTIAAERLLPLDELRAWVDGEVAADHAVTAARAAEELDVAEWVAALQLRRLEDERRRVA